MLATDLTLAAMAEALAKSADYRVLRRLVRREIFGPSVGESTKTVIELGMIKFDYRPAGCIAGVRDVFSSFNEPSAPIPPEVIALTGITNEMVAGQRIDGEAVLSFAEDTAIVIAHSASFDRTFADVTGVFQRKAWGCSRWSG